MLYLLIFILFICVFGLKNRCENIENDLNRKIYNLKLRVKDLENKNFGNVQDISQSQVEEKTEEKTEEKIVEKVEESVEEKTEKVLEENENISEQENTLVQENISEKCINPVETVINAETEAFSFEKFFMGNLFNKIGAIALIIGIGIFLKLVIWVNPTMQILSSFVIGLAMLFCSFKIHKNNLVKFSEVLMGTAFAILFVTTYCSCTIYDVLSVPIAMIVGILLVFATDFVAQKYNSFAIILIGLFGGYLNPFFIRHTESMTFLFSYLIFVNIIGVTYIRKNRDKNWVNCVNLFMTGFTVSVASIVTKNDINIIFPFLLWGLYILNDFLNPKGELNNKDICLTWLNFSLLIWFTNFIFGFNNRLLIGWTLIAVAVIYAIFAYFIARRNKYFSKIYIYDILLATAFSIFCIENSLYRFVCWLAEFGAIIYCVKKFDMKFMVNWGTAFLVVASIQGCFVENQYLALFSTILCALISIFLYKNFGTKSMKYWSLLFLTLPMLKTLTLNNMIVDDAIVKVSLLAIFSVMAFVSSKKYDIDYLNKWGIAYLVATSIQGCFVENQYFALTTTTLSAVISIFAYKVFGEKSMRILSLLFLTFPMLTTFALDNMLVKILVFAIFSVIAVASSKKYDIDFLEKWGLVYLSTSFVAVLTDMENIFSYYYPRLILHERTLRFAIPIVTAFAFEKKFYAENENFKEMLKLLYVTFIYFWMGVEMFYAISFTKFASTFLNGFIIVIAGLVYAMNIRQFNLISKNPVSYYVGYIAGLASLVLLVIMGWTYSPLENFFPVVNIRFFAFVLAMCASLFFAKNENGLKKEVLLYMTAFLGALLVHCETKDFLISNDLGLNIVLSSAWLIYAGVLMFFGIFKDIKPFKITGIWITITSVLKIVFFDLANIETVYKLIEFLILGSVLMIVSYCYTKKIKK